MRRSFFYRRWRMVLLLALLSCEVVLAQGRAGSRPDITAGSIETYMFSDSAKMYISGGGVNVMYYGFDPANSATDNYNALQTALNGGNKIIEVTKPGTYQFNHFFRIYSNTELRFGEGVTLSKVTADSALNSFINAAAFGSGTDSNIIIRGLTIKTNGLANTANKGDSLYAVRGELSFHNAKNIKVYDYTVTDLGTYHWGVGINNVDNFLLQGFEIRGDKDGVMLQNSTNVTVRDGVISTYDDRISLRGGDYPGVARTLGDLDGVLIENVRTEPYPGQSGYFVRIIPSAWVDWYNGMTVRTGDVVKNGNNVYQVINGTTTPVASTVAPTGGSRAFTTADGIEWKFCQSDGARSATVKNVTFRDIEVNSNGRPGFLSSPLEDTYMRAVYPDTNAPVVENIIVDNVNDLNTDTNPLFLFYNGVDIHISNPKTRRKLFEIRGKDVSEGDTARIVIDDWTIKDNLLYPASGDISTSDTLLHVFYHLNTTSQMRDIVWTKGLAMYEKTVSVSGNASINEAFGLNPVAGDKIQVQGKERYYDGTKWNFGGRQAIILEIDPTVSTSFTANFLGTAGRTIIVDFGDGTIKTYTLDPTTNVAVTHTYSGSKPYTILIYGDLNDLTKVDLSNYGYSVYFDVGQVADLPGLTTLQLRGNSELQGDISLLSNMINATSFQLYQSALHGNLNVIANLPSTAQYVYVYGLTGGKVTYTTTTMPAFNNINLRLQDNNLTSAEVDQILIDLAASSVSGSTCTLLLNGTNAARTSASDAAVTTLTGNGWTVTTN